MENYVYWSPQQIADSGRYSLSIGQIRHLLLYRHRNGLDRCIRKIGKRLLLRLDLFQEWIESYAQEGSK